MQKGYAYSIIALIIVGLFVVIIPTNVSAGYSFTISDTAITAFGATTCGSTNSINKVVYVDSGYVASCRASDNTHWIIRSADGITWTKVESGLISNSGADDIVSFDNIVMYAGVPSGTTNVIRRSTDGGVTFNNIVASVPATTTFSKFCIFISSTTTFKLVGVGATANTLVSYQSTDSGATLTGPTAIYTAEASSVFTLSESNHCAIQEDTTFDAFWYWQNAAANNWLLYHIYSSDGGVTLIGPSTLRSTNVGNAPSMGAHQLIYGNDVFYCIKTAVDSNEWNLYKYIASTGQVIRTATTQFTTDGEFECVVAQFDNYIYLFFSKSATPGSVELIIYSLDAISVINPITVITSSYSIAGISPYYINGVLYFLGGKATTFVFTGTYSVFTFTVSFITGDVMTGGNSPISVTREQINTITANPRHTNMKILNPSSEKYVALASCTDFTDCVYRSINDGDTWGVRNQLPGVFNSFMDYIPSATTLFNVGTAHGTTTPMITQSSTNDGLTWSAVSSLATTVYNPCIIAVSATSLVVVGLSTTAANGIVKITSANGGTTYSASTSILTPPIGTAFEYLVCSEEEDGRMGLLAAIRGSSNTVMRVYLLDTEDSGTTWNTRGYEEFTSTSASIFGLGILSDSDETLDDIFIDSTGIYACLHFDSDGAGILPRQEALFWYDYGEETFNRHLIFASVELPAIDSFCSLQKYQGSIITMFSNIDDTDNDNSYGYVEAFNTVSKAPIIQNARFESDNLIRSFGIFTRSTGNLSAIGSNNIMEPFYALSDDKFSLYNLIIPDITAPDISRDETDNIVGIPNTLLLSYDDNPTVYVGDYVEHDSVDVEDYVEGGSNQIYKYDSSLSFDEANRYCGITRSTGLVYSDRFARPEGASPVSNYGVLSVGGHSTPIVYTTDDKILTFCEEATFFGGVTYNGIAQLLNPNLQQSDYQYYDNQYSEQDLDKWPSGNGASTRPIADSLDISSNCLLFNIGNDVGVSPYVVNYNYVSNTFSNKIESSNIRSCYVDKFNNNAVIVTASGFSLVSKTNIPLLGGTSFDSSYLYAVIADNLIYVLKSTSETSSSLLKFEYETGTLTQIGSAVSTPAINKYMTLSLDGKYISMWGDTTHTAYLYNTTSMEKILTINLFIEGENQYILDMKIDKNNNYVYSLQYDSILEETQLSKSAIYTQTQTTCDDALIGTLNPNCDITGIDSGGDNLITNKPTETVIDGGFIGDAHEGNGAFGGLITQMQHIFPSGMDGAAMFLGFIIVIACMVLMYNFTESPTGMIFGAFAGTGLSLAIGFLPIWVMYSITFVLILLIGKSFLGSSSGGEV